MPLVVGGLFHSITYIISTAHNYQGPDLFIRKFTNEAVVELERFYSQKVSDFRSILINFVQLQMHINKKVIGSS